MAPDFDVVNLRREIEAAFSDVHYPGDDNLVAVWNPASLDAVSRFKGCRWLDWKDRPLELLHNSRQDLSFFSLSAFLYYLPLYLLAALADYDRARPFLGGLIGLFDPKSLYQNEIMQGRLRAMTGRQLKVFVSFLKFIRHEHGKDLSFWYPLDKAFDNVQGVAEVFCRDLDAVDPAAATIKAEIETAFADVPYPGDDALIEHFCPECQETADRFKGLKWKDWKDKPLALFSQSRTELGRFSPQAFRYYLPLFMVQTLLDYEYANGVPELIAFLLTPRPGRTEYIQKRYRLMTAREIQAVVSFLEFLKAKHGDSFPGPRVDEAIKTARDFFNCQESFS